MVDQASLDAVSCASPRLCVTGSSSDFPGLRISTNPFGGPRDWREKRFPPNPAAFGTSDGVRAVSCPSVRLCVSAGGVVGTDVPAGVQGIDAVRPLKLGRVTHVATPYETNAISCASTRLCVAVGADVRTSTNPAAKHPRWRVVYDDSHPIEAISCHGQSLCVAVDTGGQVLVNTDPAAPQPIWTTQTIDPTESFTGVSCPTTRTCVLVDSHGYATVIHR
jgi:hypothetical protein